jgi:imidazolonepropionase-like amidohydrolase
VPGDGLRVGPRLVRPGLVVDGPKPGSSYRLTVTNEAEAREAVRSLKQQGMDFVKIHNAMGREAYFALADESRKQGIRFAGHVPKAVSLEEACDAGQASLEHMDTFTEGTLAARAKDRPLPDVFMEYEKAEAPALVACLARRGVAVTPTLNRTLTATQLMESRAETDPRNVYLSDNAKRLSDRYAPLTMALPEAFLAQRKQLFPVYQRLVASMQRAGVLILAGTDLAGRGVYPGFSLHDELKALVDAGLTPLQALQTATRNPAKYLGRLADSGDVGKGKLADLVVLDANPLEDVRNTTRVNAVVLSGRYYDRSALDGLLALARSEARE